MARRIAILLTSNDTSAFAARHADDGEKFRRLLQPWRPDWSYETVPVKDGVFPGHIDDHDGYVIAGSPASVHDSDPWIARLMDFIRALEAARKPTVGACFGHQAIALALGGTVERNPGGWSIGVETTGFAVHEPWMRPPREALRLFSAHREQVTALPPGAKLLGGNDFCPVGTFSIGDHIFATEYHPEMTDDFLTDLVGEMADVIGPDLRDQALDEIARGAQGAEFAGWMMDFFDRETT